MTFKSPKEARKAYEKRRAERVATAAQRIRVLVEDAIDKGGCAVRWMTAFDYSADHMSVMGQHAPAFGGPLDRMEDVRNAAASSCCSAAMARAGISPTPGFSI